MTTQSQEKRILKHLQSGRGITPLDALKKFGCFRLSARCYDLIKKGHNIKTEMVTQNKKRFAKYFLK